MELEEKHERKKEIHLTPEQIKEARKRLGYSWHRLAYEVGVSFMTIYRWETGKARPNKLSRRALRRVLKRGLMEIDTGPPPIDKVPPEKGQ